MEEEVKYCKNCKRDISAKNYVIHTVHCERNIQLCERCSEPVPRSELEKHEEEFHSKVACSECGISVEKCKIEKHKEACTKKLVPCEYCELEVPLDNLSEHSAACGSRTEQCSNCNKHIMIKDLQQHPISCSRREPESVPCEYCGLQINLNEMMEHTVMCGTQTERCHLCKEHVMVQDRDAHFVTCGKKRQLNPEFPCKYCGELYLSDFLKDHADECGTRIRKCEKCDQLIALKNMEMHSNVCKESVSKTHGNCPICHQSIAWMEMNVHYAYCAHINCEINEYEYQNEINELALRKESEALRNEISDKKKSQIFKKN